MSSNPVLFITGANTGLGYETIRSLLQSPKAYTILLGGRSIDKANTAAEELKREFPQSSSTISTVQIDIADDDSITAAYDHISKEHGRVDILINNAGAAFDHDYHYTKKITSMRELWNTSWNVNTSGTQVTTQTFVPLLLKSSDARLIFITSGTSTMEESITNKSMALNRSPEKGWPKEKDFNVAAYRSAKAGMNMMMREWARILGEDGVKVWCISPGFLATGLGGNKERNKAMGALDPEIGANFVRDVVEGKRDEDVGRVVRSSGVQPF